MTSEELQKHIFFIGSPYTPISESLKSSGILIEALFTEVCMLRIEVQELKDEINRRLPKG